jgi:hypothetical protein
LPHATKHYDNLRKERNMSPETVTTGGVAEASEPKSTHRDNGEPLSIRYRVPEAAPTFWVELPPRPPERLLLSVVVAFENNAVYMRAVEVDVSTEGETPHEAVESLVSGITEWLKFLQEEQPDLSPDLEPQRRYVELLNYSPATWFGPVRVS